MELSNEKTHLAYSYLREAVQTRDEETVIYLLNHHLPSSIAQRVDEKKLILRVFRNTLDNLEEQKSILKILRLLLDRGADVNITDNAGQTALHLAIANRMTEVIDFLISRGANLKLRDKFANTILHFLIESEFRKFKNCGNIFDAVEKEAFCQRSTDFIQQMMPKLSELFHCKNERQDTAIHLAAKYNLLHALPILLKHTKAAPLTNDRYMTAFQVFIESVVCGTMVETFASNVNEPINTNVCTDNKIGIPISNYESTLVEVICEEFLKRKYSVDVIDDRKNTPLHYVLKQRRRNFAKMMLNHIKHVNIRDADGNSALNIIMNYCEDKFYQFGNEDEEMIRILVAKKANIHLNNKKASSPLITAIRYRKLAVLKIFKDSDANFCHRYKENLLFHFFKSKIETDAETYEEVFNLLVDQGCDVNAKDIMGMTPLHFAVRLGNIRIVKKLIEFKANVNSRESIRGYTPLHEAIVYKRNEVVKLLINSGANVNANTFKGQGPLHLVENGSEKAIGKLIKKSAHLDAMDLDGFLPLQLAILNQNDLVIKMLLKFGADINDDTNTPALGVNGYTVSKCITEHLIKLKVAKQPIDDKLKAYLTSDLYTTEVHDNCVVEVESLKMYKIDDDTSLYNVLHMDRNFMCTFVKNKKFKELIHSLTFKTEFPIYHQLISAVYYMGLRRRKLLEPAKLAWLELTNIKLPDFCIYHILSNLTNANLKLMAKKNVGRESPIKKDINKV